MMCIMFVSLSCLMKMEYECLFHVKYDLYTNVKHKHMIVVPVLYKCLCFSFSQDVISEALHSYSTSLLPHQTAQITFAFCALL